MWCWVLGRVFCVVGGRKSGADVAVVAAVLCGVGRLHVAAAVEVTAAPAPVGQASLTCAALHTPPPSLRTALCRAPVLVGPTLQWRKQGLTGRHVVPVAAGRAVHGVHAVRGVCDVRGVAVQGTAGAGPVSDTASHAAQELPAEDFPTSPHSGKHWRCPVLHPEAVDGGPGSVLLGGENGGVGVDDDAGGADADGGDDGDDDGDDGGGGDGGGEADADTDDGDGDGDEAPVVSAWRLLWPAPFLP